MNQKWALIGIALMVVIGFPSTRAVAKPLTRKEASRYVSEGEYDLNGKKSRSLKRAPASHKKSKPVVRNTHKKKTAKKGYPPKSHAKVYRMNRSRMTSHKAPGKPKRLPASVKKRHKAHSSSRSPTRLPYAKETPHERDMPFISVPKSKVRKENKTIVMEDPGMKAPVLKPILTEPVDNVDPATVERTPAAAREPDAIDIHSGADPMRDKAD